jgi:hypothetical protein
MYIYAYLHTCIHVCSKYTYIPIDDAHDVICDCSLLIAFATPIGDALYPILYPMNKYIYMCLDT